MLISAKDDFERRTLAAVAGSWAKLEYVAGLRQDDGGYFHWGLAREFGEKAAHETIAGAHRRIFLHLLRTPLGALVGELRQAISSSQERSAYVEKLRKHGQALIPADCGGGSRRHFNSVLQAMCRLATSRNGSGPASSRSRPPARSLPRP